MTATFAPSLPSNGRTMPSGCSSIAIEQMLGLDLLVLISFRQFDRRLNRFLSLLV